MFTARLVRIESTNKKLPLGEVVGYGNDLPMVGSSFKFVINKNTLLTSEVVEVRDTDDGMVFKTKNSIYLIENIKKVVT